MRHRHASMVAAAAILLALQVPLQHYLDRQGQRARETSTVSTDIDPETYLTTVLLAGFRAIAIDVAWVRADYFQRSGDLWAVQPTLQLITELQPSLEPVWNHIAWHLAFNMSLEERWDDPAARWDWVDAGLATLERGLERNPRSYLLRQELGWILFVKCVRADKDEDAPYFASRYEESRGRPPLAAAIDYLRQARAIPEHVEAVLPLCPTLYAALSMRYEQLLADYDARPSDEAYAALVTTLGDLLDQREHMIIDHGRTRAMTLDSYPLPVLPPR